VLLAVLLTASFGSSELVVDDAGTTAIYSQQPASLSLLSPVDFSATLAGSYSASFDWSPVDTIFVEAAVDGANPNVQFSLELYGWDGSAFQFINGYQGFTAGLGSAFSLVELQLSTPGSGDFSNFQGIQFTIDSVPEVSAGLTLRSVVGSAGPIDPTITSVAFNDGSFTMTWSGTGMLPVNIKRRESLIEDTWITVAQGVADGQYTDALPPPRQAFYRVVVP
jgi:hypothetical protein